jgi:hypothetical protein
MHRETVISNILKTFTEEELSKIVFIGPTALALIQTTIGQRIIGINAITDSQETFDAILQRLNISKDIDQHGVASALISEEYSIRLLVGDKAEILAEKNSVATSSGIRVESSRCLHQRYTALLKQDPTNWRRRNILAVLDDLVTGNALASSGAETAKHKVTRLNRAKGISLILETFTKEELGKILFSGTMAFLLVQSETDQEFSRIQAYANEVTFNSILQRLNCAALVQTSDDDCTYVDIAAENSIRLWLSPNAETATQLFYPVITNEGLRAYHPLILKEWCLNGLDKNPLDLHLKGILDALCALLKSSPELTRVSSSVAATKHL